MKLTRAARPATTTEPKAELGDWIEEKRSGIELRSVSMADLKFQIQVRINQTTDSYLRSTGFINKPSLMGTKTSSRSATTSVEAGSD